MGRKKLRSLRDLEGLSVKPPEPAPKPEPPRPREPDADELFFDAMTGVNPLPENMGRPMPARPETLPQPPAPPQPSSMDHVLQREVGFDILFGEEYVQAGVKGLDPRIMSRLKAGGFSPQAHLDLHGLNLEQAGDALLFFVRQAYMADKRCLLLITGRGKNSPQGRSVLKEEVQSRLTREPFRRVVLAFCSALPRDGGLGALYVLLRKFRKSEGKVLWDRAPFDEP